MLNLLDSLSKFVTDLRRERQIGGIAKAKANGVYKGRPRPVDAASVEKLKAEGLGASEIDKRLGIGRASIYRALSTLSVK